MATKKKNSLNRTGLYYFAAEYRDQHGHYAGRSIQDLIALVLPRWRSMSLIERKPYEDQAKQYKRLQRLSNEQINTPVIPSREEALFIEKNSQENQFLTSYLSIDLLPLSRREFFFVTFQIFCRTDDEDGGDYYPAELAILKYSLLRSCIEEYFTMVKPEKFPVGYTGTVIDLSRQTHQIPPFDFIGANGDYPQIWREIERILGGEPNDEPILIFCRAFEREQTNYLLNWFASKGEMQKRRKPIFQIYSFESLVVALLRRLALGDYAHQSVREQLHRPVYTLQIKERCVYHHSLAIQYCARAINHGFRMFLDDFIRERFLPLLPPVEKKEVIIHEPTLISCSDSLSSMNITEELPTQQGDQVDLVSSTRQRRIPPTVQVDCRWSTSSLRPTPLRINEEKHYIMTGRGIRPFSQHSPIVFSGIGRGRSITHFSP